MRYKKWYISYTEINNAEATTPSKLHLGIQKQLHCFVLSINKLTSKPKSSRIHKKIRRKKEMERNGTHTHNKIK